MRTSLAADERCPRFASWRRGRKRHEKVPGGPSCLGRLAPTGPPTPQDQRHSSSPAGSWFLTPDTAMLRQSGQPSSLQCALPALRNQRRARGFDSGCWRAPELRSTANHTVAPLLGGKPQRHEKVASPLVFSGRRAPAGPEQETGRGYATHTSVCSLYSGGTLSHG